ncbi:MAG: DUF4124 domain-containing protein [Betaproteobacteria bacterium]|nr:MAG: DUF4124 domain-containing protein [Betaproteobacteria bacterium]
MNRLSIAIGLALCLAVPASAQMYKWVDANGKVQYSDKPPPSNVKVEKLREPARAAVLPQASEVKSGTDKDASKTGPKKSEPKTAAEQEQAFRKRQADAAKEQEKQAQKETELKNRAEDCRRAKAALAVLELGGRQARIDEKGERVFLNEQQIAQETAKARQEVATACN